MSFIAKVWNAIRAPVRYVGRDLEGNRFFESRSLNDSAYMRRTVQYHNPEESWRYIGGGKRLPIQWSAWLTHTRKEPPTLEELQGDIRRQQRLAANVALIEARDRAESEEMLRIRRQDVQLALADAAAQVKGDSPLVEAGAATLEADAGTSHSPVEVSLDATSKDVGSDSSSKNAGKKTKVLLPSFLTPSTPRKSRSAKPFTLPSISIDDTVGGNVSSPARAQEEHPSPWKSKPQPETESWTPKAVRRG